MGLFMTILGTNSESFPLTKGCLAQENGQSLGRSGQRMAGFLADLGWMPG
jgi:hypothetical protein